MKKLLTLACAVLSVAAMADATADFKRFMAGMKGRVEKAFATKDIKFFETSTTVDFTEVMSGRTTSKAESMAGLKQWFGMTDSIKANFKMTSCSVNGDSATANLTSHMVAKMKPMKKGAKASTMVMDSWEKQTYVKDGKGWKLKKLEETKPPKTTMDGKPFDISKMGG